MAIPSSQARAEFTSMLADTFKDWLAPTGFIRSFFPSFQSFTKYVSFQIQRKGELKATDVPRTAEGNRNTFSKSTEKLFEPPDYSEYFDATEFDLYDRMFGSSEIDEGAYSQLMQECAERLMELRAKIERELEYQAAQALLTGTLAYANADPVNFQRKAASLVANSSGNTFATNTVDPFAIFGAGCKFLRTVGKCPDTIFNAILGEQAQYDLYNNAIFKDRVTQSVNNTIDTINAPRLNTEGAAFHGQLSCGSWKVNLWTYPQYYQTSVGGSSTAYIDPKKYILLPSTTGNDFRMAHAAVPQVLIEATSGMGNIVSAAPVAENYVIDNLADGWNHAHKIRIRTRAMPVLKAVDRVYTEQVCA